MFMFFPDYSPKEQIYSSSEPAQNASLKDSDPNCSLYSFYEISGVDSEMLHDETSSMGRAFNRQHTEHPQRGMAHIKSELPESLYDEENINNYVPGELGDEKKSTNHDWMDPLLVKSVSDIPQLTPEEISENETPPDEFIYKESFRHQIEHSNHGKETSSQVWSATSIGRNAEHSGNKQGILTNTHTRKKPLKLSLEKQAKMKYGCPLCNLRLPTPSHVRDHVRTHTGERPFQCKVCGKAFSKTGNLNVHMRIHTGEKPYMCDLCSKGFSRRDLLTQHKVTHSLGEHNCPVCQQRFGKRADMISHLGTCDMTPNE